jgi:hypothetical protein
MQYTLITEKGKLMQFFIFEVATLYQTIYGGVVITQSVLETETAELI